MKTKLMILITMLLSSMSIWASISPVYQGQVTDSNNNPVPGVPIVILNNCTNQTYTTYTDVLGNYFYQDSLFNNPQQCEIIIIAMDSINCADTISFWINPSMNGVVTFTNNLSLQCSGSGCNIAWGFTTNPVDACMFDFWHQGSLATWYFTDNNTTTTSSQTFPSYSWNASGTYQVCIEFPNCAPQCTNITVTPNCQGSSSVCNTAWGVYFLSSCTIQMWHQGNTSAFWQVTGPNTNYQSTDVMPQLSFNQTGTYIVELILDSCYYVDTLYVDSVCGNAYPCNISWGYSAVPNNACAYQFWHQSSSAIWYFTTPNGTTTTTQNFPVFSWNAPGTYQVCVEFPNCAIQCTTITVTPNCTNNNTSCMAYFTWYVDPTTNETYINNLSTGSPIQYSWDYGDGNGGLGYNPSHTYNSPGWYLVCLTIGTPNTPSCYETYCDTVYIPSAQLRINGPAFIEAENEISVLEIYPNPATDQIHISVPDLFQGDVAIEIIGISGKFMRSLSKKINADSILTIGVEDLSSGIYILRFTDQQSGKSFQSKFIK